MFAIKSENRTQDTNANQDYSKLLKDKILLAYKKLKSVAKSELSTKNKFKLAQLSDDKLNKLKSMEAGMGCFLVAYNYDHDLSKKKVEILNRINLLLNQYSNLSKTSSEKKTEDDFSEFFQQ